ncbi:hypothetical protein CAAN1_01S07074 [[Candida] anglica]|uniref:Uncharacterized protein n=1 Tax=[Candida] anglica TaxID=148631 RepID=A0ABP0ENA5_9ASCO
MPPKLKAKPVLVTILKFKRKRTTYSIPFNLSEKKVTLDWFISTLKDTIESSGGLQDDNDTTELGENNLENEDDLDIEIPKSELIDEPELELSEPTPETLTPAPASAPLIQSKLKLAIAKDKTAPYDNNWVELTTDDQLSAIIFNDYDILAFSYDDEPFHIVEAAYDEPQ